MSWSIRKPVVVPFDFSDHSKSALKRALEIADDAKNVHVVHVLPYLVPAEPGVVWASVDDSERMDHALESMRKALLTPEFANVKLEVRIGDPGQVAVNRATELGAELIVIGSHGRTGISRLFLGSVAERVVRLAHCPVLVEKISVLAQKSTVPSEKKQPAGVLA